MMMKVTKTEILSAEINDEPGGLSLALKALADFGASLDCVVSRRSPEKPGKGVVFVSAPNRKKMFETPDQAGFKVEKRIPTLKIESADRPGLTAELTQLIADAGISMRGLTASAIGHKCICFIGFDTIEDRDKAEAILREFGKKHSRWHGLLRRKIEEKEHKAK